MGVIYTYFQSTGSGSATAPDGGTLYPTMTRPGLVDNVTDAQATSSLRLQIYDAEFGRTIAVDETLSLRLAGGLEFASILQQQNASYNGGDAVNTLVETHSDFNGVGPMLSGAAEWHLGYGFSLFGRTRAALLYGSTRTHLRETNQAGAVVNADLTDNYSQVVPFLNVGLGVGWEYHGLQVRLGYEINQWFDLGDYPFFTDDFAEGHFTRQHSNLGLDGFFAQIAVSF
jgi:hypothetical protein